MEDDSKNLDSDPYHKQGLNKSFINKKANNGFQRNLYRYYTVSTKQKRI